MLHSDNLFKKSKYQLLYFFTTKIALCTNKQKKEKALILQ